MQNLSLSDYKENIQKANQASEAVKKSISEILGVRENQIALQTSIHEKRMICIGLEWWVYCTAAEADQILQRKENYYHQQLNELSTSIEFLKSRQNILNTVLQGGGNEPTNTAFSATESAEDDEIVDIKEDVPSEDSTLENISIKLKDIELNDTTTRPLYRIAHTSSISDSITRSTRGKQKEEQKELRELFDRYEKEEGDNQELERAKKNSRFNTIKSELKREHSPSFESQQLIKKTSPNTKKSVKFTEEAPIYISDSGTSDESDASTEDDRDADEDQDLIEKVESPDIDFSQKSLMAEVVQEYEKLKLSNSIHKASSQDIQSVIKIVDNNESESIETSPRQERISRFKAERQFYKS